MKKKKKKAKVIKIILFVLLILTIGGLTWYFKWGKDLLSSTETEETSIELSSDQTMVIAKLTAVNGNEISYTVMDAVIEETEDVSDVSSGNGNESFGATEGHDGNGHDFDKNSLSGNDQMAGGHGGKGSFSDVSGNSDAGAFMPNGQGSDVSGSMPDMSSMPQGQGTGSAPSMPGDTSDSDSSSSMPDMSNLPQMSGSDSSTGSDFSGSMPDTGNFPQMSGSDSSTGSDFSGSMPDMSSMPSMSGGSDSGFGGFSGGNSDFGGGFGGGMGNFSGFGSSSGSGTSKNTDSLTYNDTTYTLSDETVTELIPVGTSVTTKLGTVTTFSRLEAGDFVAIVTENVDGTDVIVAVYIIG